MSRLLRLAKTARGMFRLLRVLALPSRGLRSLALPCQVIPNRGLPSLALPSRVSLDRQRRSLERLDQVLHTRARPVQVIRRQDILTLVTPSPVQQNQVGRIQATRHRGIPILERRHLVTGLVRTSPLNRVIPGQVTSIPGKPIRVRLSQGRQVRVTVLLGSQTPAPRPRFTAVVLTKLLNLVTVVLGTPTRISHPRATRIPSEVTRVARMAGPLVRGLPTRATPTVVLPVQALRKVVRRKVKMVATMAPHQARPLPESQLTRVAPTVARPVQALRKVVLRTTARSSRTERPRRVQRKVKMVATMAPHRASPQAESRLSQVRRTIARSSRTERHRRVRRSLGSQTPERRRAVRSALVHRRPVLTVTRSSVSTATTRKLSLAVRARLPRAEKDDLSVMKN